MATQVLTGHRLKVVVVKAKEIKSTNFFTKSASDSFVDLNVKDGVTKSTEVVFNTLEPEFRQEFVFELEDPPEGEILSVKMWGRHKIGSNTFIGRIEIPVSFVVDEQKGEKNAFTEGTPIEKWFKLLPKEGYTNYESAPGFLRLRLQYVYAPEVIASSTPEQQQQAVLPPQQQVPQAQGQAPPGTTLYYQCPLCNQLYLPDVINDHMQNCAKNRASQPNVTTTAPPPSTTQSLSPPSTNPMSNQPVTSITNAPMPTTQVTTQVVPTNNASSYEAPPYTTTNFQPHNDLAPPQYMQPPPQLSPTSNNNQQLQSALANEAVVKANVVATSPPSQQVSYTTTSVNDTTSFGYSTQTAPNYTSNESSVTQSVQSSYNVQPQSSTPGFSPAAFSFTNADANSQQLNNAQPSYGVGVTTQTAPYSMDNNNDNNNNNNLYSYGASAMNSDATSSNNLYNDGNSQYQQY